MNMKWNPVGLHSPEADQVDLAGEQSQVCLCLNQTSLLLLPKIYHYLNWQSFCSRPVNKQMGFSVSGISFQHQNYPVTVEIVADEQQHLYENLRRGCAGAEISWRLMASSIPAMTIQSLLLTSRSANQHKKNYPRFRVESLFGMVMCMCYFVFVRQWHKFVSEWRPNWHLGSNHDH